MSHMLSLLLGLLLFSVPVVASEIDPELLALIGKYRLIHGDEGCLKRAEVVKVRSEESLTIKDPSRDDGGNEISIFPDINEGKVTYYEDMVRIKQRNTVYEHGHLKKNLRTCSGIIMQTCYAWKTVASIRIISSQSFEIYYERKSCRYESVR